MVVVGDSEFVSNAALRTGAAGNEDFFLSTLNWLVDREALMAVAPKRPAELRMGLDSRRVLRLYLLLTVVLPGAVGLMGLGVWLRRRS
jgi:ABC-type uncharacterized transport system involved in gliding motility auxiliary subunit